MFSKINSSSLYHRTVRFRPGATLGMSHVKLCVSPSVITPFKLLELMLMFSGKAEEEEEVVKLSLQVIAKKLISK